MRASVRLVGVNETVARHHGETGHEGRGAVERSHVPNEPVVTVLEQRRAQRQVERLDRAGQSTYDQ